LKSLSGKTALVTGASRGIGRASALALGKAGAQVLVHYAHAEKEADAVVAEIRLVGGRAEKVSADLALRDGSHRLAKQVRGIVGERLDILVANAGISSASAIEQTTVDDFDKLYAVGPYVRASRISEYDFSHISHGILFRLCVAFRNIKRYARALCVKRFSASPDAQRFCGNDLVGPRSRA
jgi:NAD(P)-dependent dehydrogenase (short-subunit alcohol dehydrogenase family)